jgi:hypothetical protein
MPKREGRRPIVIEVAHHDPVAGTYPFFRRYAFRGSGALQRVAFGAWFEEVL